jgi:phosphoribosylformylglycinamidine synthase
MALAGDLGAELEIGRETALHAWLFGEDQARYLVATAQAATLLEDAAAHGVPAQRIGRTGGDALKLPGHRAISVAALKRAHEAWLPAYMAGADTDGAELGAAETGTDKGTGAGDADA